MQQDHLERLFKTVQVLSIVAGVVVTVLSFNQARKQEADAQQSEAAKQQLEAAKPFLDCASDYILTLYSRQRFSLIQRCTQRTSWKQPRKRFRELYVAELSMVEGANVEAEMVQVARAVDPDLLKLSPAQKAAYDLAHALRNSLVTSWNVDEKIVDNRR